MCGIFGVVIGKNCRLTSPQLTDITNSLFWLSASRGKEASGFILADDSITFYKEPRSSADLTKTQIYKDLTGAFFQTRKTVRSGKILIGHSRLATNGDASDNNNNQPVRAGNVVGVHNGIIVNDKQILRKFPQISQKTRLDSVILFNLVNHYARNFPLPEAVVKTFSEVSGSASVALVHAGYPCLMLATNTGSLYIAHDKIRRFIVFASEWFIVNQVLERVGIKSLPIQQITANSGYMVTSDLLIKQKFYLKIGGGRKQRQHPAVTGSRTPIRELEYRQESGTAVFIPAVLNSLNQLKSHKIDTDAITRLRRCSRCILPETMPLISFDDRGVCNYCRNFKMTPVLGIKNLEEQLKIYRYQQNPGNCLVAFSGGRDSSYGLHLVKKVLRMHPIAYTYDWGMVTDLARRNQARITGKLGVEQIIVSADIGYKRANIRKNVTAWLNKPDLGMIPLFMAGDKQAEFYAEDVKRKTGINLMIYCRGNELENEEFKWGYCGIKNSAPAGVIHNLSFRGKLQLALYYGSRFLTNPYYINTSLFDTLFAYFVTYGMRLDFLYLWHYYKWNETEINNHLIKEYGWETDPETATTWRIGDGSVPFYNYIYYALQGFTENDALRSNQIRAGILSRKNALEMVYDENKPRYEGLKWYFDAIEIDGNRALQIVDALPKLYKV